MSESLHDRVVGAIGEQYELQDEIGRGGMSIVYRARDRRLSRSVAIKVLPPELAHDTAIRARFTREAQTAAHLSHAHIVPIYDVGDRNGIAYIVMGMITGGNLATLLAREPRQPIDEVRRLLAEIADALDYAHLRGVIHRDIKPDNILLDRDTGRAMVTDFGIAWGMESATRLTNTGIAVGTPTYMSPEQAVGEREIDGRTDIYSLGVIGFQMLTGRVPFAASNSMALLLKHVTESPRPILELRPDTPQPLQAAVERALMKSPEDRWPTAAHMREALTSETPVLSWRSDRREPVHYTSPPHGTRRDRSSRDARRGSAISSRPEPPPVAPLDGELAPPRAPGAITLVPPHLATLTREQREDLRLWHGRVTLMERIKAMRGYAFTTLSAIVAGLIGIGLGFSESEAAPLVLLSPIIPVYMTRKLWLRGRSLRESGLKLRRVLLMPRARWVLPKKLPAPESPLEHLAPREVLENPRGAAIRSAVDDRAAILDIVSRLSKADRAMIPDLAPAVDGLVERVSHLAQMLDRLDRSIDSRRLADLDARIAWTERESDGSPEGDRRLELLRRQRDSVHALMEQRTTLERQLDSAGLLLGNLRLDMIRLRSSGMESVLSDVSSATQEVRALSRDIGIVLEAAAEARNT